MTLTTSLVDRALKRVRPGTSIAPDQTARAVGWYLRMGLMPAVRGLPWRLRVKTSSFPLFIGVRVSMLYGRHLHLGRSVFIGANSRINALSVRGVRIGDQVTIREGAWIQCSSGPGNPGVGLTIGSGTYIGPQVILGVGGPISIGSGVQFGAGCVLISENHDIDATGRPSRSEVVRKGITIGDNCWLGHRATILDGVELGENSIVGAGSVVTRSFPPNSTVVGVPARPIPSA